MAPVAFENPKPIPSRDGFTGGSVMIRVGKAPPPPTRSCWIQNIILYLQDRLSWIVTDIQGIHERCNGGMLRWNLLVLPNVAIKVCVNDSCFLDWILVVVWTGSSLLRVWHGRLAIMHFVVTKNFRSKPLAYLLWGCATHTAKQRTTCFGLMKTALNNVFLPTLFINVVNNIVEPETASDQVQQCWTIYFTTLDNVGSKTLFNAVSINPQLVDISCRATPRVINERLDVKTCFHHIPGARTGCQKSEIGTEK